MLAWNFDLKKFANSAVKPFVGTAVSSYHDLCSAGEYLIYPNSVQVINTDIGIAILYVFLGKIFTRRSWALKITCVEGGVVDSDYRGKIKVIFTINQ